ncbi:MAG: hypothetical protein KAS66_00880 [Candidatus Omnitrophica bacterium]|nr:hypothetical protein [Candidatus Omnitrophota bacterium]
MMKKLLWIALLLSFTGCVSSTIPNYIQDKNPYKKTFYGPFDKVQEAITKAFEESGWAIEKESRPDLFERDRGLGSVNKQTLIFTEVRQASFFVGSRYARINAYLNETANNETAVEIRYLNVTLVMFKSFYRYKNDHAVEHIFSKIEENLSC